MGENKEKFKNNFKAALKLKKSAKPVNLVVNNLKINLNINGFWGILSAGKVCHLYYWRGLTFS